MAAPLLFSVLSVGLFVGTLDAQAQTQDPQAQQRVRTAVKTELDADRNDHSRWQYLSTVRRPEGEFVYQVVETDNGSVKKKIRENGRPLSPDDLEKGESAHLLLRPRSVPTGQR